ncbi:MAG TPA: lipoyl domain-containing protein [Amycolatopsis sp.]|nr:lipoyl domain-containing protein [Amycolatopsis sp.]
MPDSTLATWFATGGATVAEGDLIAEVAMDKVDAEVPAPAAGVIRLLVGEGDVAKQGGHRRIE